MMYLIAVKTVTEMFAFSLNFLLGFWLLHVLAWSHECKHTYLSLQCQPQPQIINPFPECWELIVCVVNKMITHILAIFFPKQLGLSRRIYNYITILLHLFIRLLHINKHTNNTQILHWLWKWWIYVNFARR